MLLCARAGVKNLPGYPEGLKLHMSVTVNHKGRKKIFIRNIGRENKRYRTNEERKKRKKRNIKRKE